jgi:hypothetical protein
MNLAVVRESLKSLDVVFGVLLIVIWGSCIREPVEVVRVLEFRGAFYVFSGS